MFCQQASGFIRDWLASQPPIFFSYIIADISLHFGYYRLYRSPHKSHAPAYQIMRQSLDSHYWQIDCIICLRRFHYWCWCHWLIYFYYLLIYREITKNEFLYFHYFYIPYFSSASICHDSHFSQMHHASISTFLHNYCATAGIFSWIEDFRNMILSIQSTSRRSRRWLLAEFKIYFLSLFSLLYIALAAFASISHWFRSSIRGLFRLFEPI